MNKLILVATAALSLALHTGNRAHSQQAAGEGTGYLFSIAAEEDFERMSISDQGLESFGVDRTTKFTVPAADDPDLLQPVFQNVNLYKFHFDFLRIEFPGLFPNFEGDEYLALVEKRATRRYFAGYLFRFKGEPDSTYSFDVFTLSGDKNELPTQEEVRWIHDRLAPVFTISTGPLSYAPRNPDAIREAKKWIDPGFNINFGFGTGGADFIPYTISQNYGRVRVMTQEDFDKANETGAFGSQDIVVLEQAPADIEGVIAGAITGSIQSELGHLAIRTGRRGSPNAFVRNALSAFERWNGKLVFLDVGSHSFSVNEATLDQAEAWWAAHRPNLGARFPFDFDVDYRNLDSAWDVPLDGSVSLVTRYGGKGSNFARLYPLIPEFARTPGFVVPVSYYIEFMETNKTASRKNPGRLVSFSEYVEELLAEPDFRGDTLKRFKELEKLRDLLEDESAVLPDVQKAVQDKIIEVFGRNDRPVRCRSSSNTEDLLEFNGAGLYTSTGACLSDDLDSETIGPSRCDPAELKERGVARGLKKVWASLWNFRAFEEREYFQIPHSKAKMAVLVSEAFPDELANGVSFTGNPTILGDRRFVVNGQVGDLSVVFTDPTVTAEKDILEIQAGQVAAIIRARVSSEVPAGTYVLNDDQLKELGALMALVESQYKVELGSHRPEEVVLDFEWKLDRHTGRIRLKQVRPFLIASGAVVQPSEFKITFPEGMILCANFSENRPVRRVLEEKAQVKLRAGEHTVKQDASSDPFEWLKLSPDGPELAPIGKGIWIGERIVSTDEGFRLHTWQNFHAPGGETLRVAIVNLLMRDGDATEIELDANALTWAINPYTVHVEYGSPNDDPEAPTPTTNSTWFLPCDPTHLPKINIDAEFAGGDRFHAEERFDDVFDGTGPAELVLGRASLGGQSQEITDYWRLGYTAGHHNDFPFPEHWLVFDPLLNLPGIAPAVKALAVARGFKEDEPTAWLLDENYQKIKDLEVVFYRRLEEGVEEIPQFRRGDANSSGKVNVTDAIAILVHLFDGGELLCPDAADFDDIGTVELDDVILLLQFLFLGLDAPAAPGPYRCGLDVDQFDDLENCNGRACR